MQNEKVKDQNHIWNHLCWHIIITSLYDCNRATVRISTPTTTREASRPRVSLVGPRELEPGAGLILCFRYPDCHNVWLADVITLLLLPLEMFTPQPPICYWGVQQRWAGLTPGHLAGGAGEGGHYIFYWWLWPAAPDCPHQIHWLQTLRGHHPGNCW